MKILCSAILLLWLFDSWNTHQEIERSPFFAAKDSADESPADSVSFGNFNLAFNALEFPDFQNLAPLEFVAGMKLSSHLSPFKPAIEIIFGTGADKKMFESYAYSDIAFVQNAHSFRHQLALVEHPGSDMRLNRARSFSPNSNFSIPIPAASKPEVAIICPWLMEGNLGPKSLCETFGESLRREKFGDSLVLHIKTVLMCHASGSANCAGASTCLGGLL